MLGDWQDDQKGTKSSRGLDMEKRGDLEVWSEQAWGCGGSLGDTGHSNGELAKGISGKAP